MAEARPPALTRRLLALLLPRESSLAIQRDLDEAFASWVAEERGVRGARRWYRAMAWESVAHVWADAIRRGTTKGVDVDGMRQDLRWAVRSALRRPGFTAMAVATLALGIGAATAVYSVVDQVLLRPLDLPEPERLVAIWTLDDGELGNSSGPNLLDLRDGVSAFQAAYLFTRDEAVLESPDGTRHRQPILRVSAGMLAALGLRPALGRDITDTDEDPGAAPVVLLSYARWRADFGADPSVVGRTVSLDGTSTEVVGILPADLQIPMAERADLVTPLVRTGMMTARDLVWLGAIARVADGVSLERARAEASGVWEGLRGAYPDALVDSRVAVVPLQSYLVEDVRPALLALMAATAVLLLMACVNVAGLLLARGRSRQAELAIRSSLGAPRRRLVRQLLVEGGLLTLLASALGLTLATLGVRALLTLAPAELTQVRDVAVDPRILVVCLGASMLVGLGTTLLPGIAATHSDPARHFAGRGSVGRRGRRRAVLVVVQVAAATVLCAGAALLGRSLFSLTSVDPGYRVADIVTAQITLPAGEYDDREHRADVLRRIETETRALPDVVDAGLTLMRPLSDSRINYDVAIDGQPPAPAGQDRVADLQLATGGHFRALDIHVVDGRVFDDAEGRDDPRVAVVSQSLAEDLWPEGRAVGHRIRWVSDRDAEPTWYEVIGVVDDIHQQSPGEPRHGTLYVSLLQVPQLNATLTVRVRGDVAGTTRALRDLVPRVAAGAPEPEIATLAEALRTTLSASRFNAALFSLFAGIALVLAGMGVYGTLAYAVATRRREIGLRMALGASRVGTLARIAGDGFAHLLLGTAIGLGASLGMAGLMAGLLYQVPPRDPLTYAMVAGVLVLVGAAAAAAPAWRASRVDPALTLRSEE